MKAAGHVLGRARAIGLLAFLIFGPLANLLLWAFAERWYFPAKLPQEFGFAFWLRVFQPRGNALQSLVTSAHESEHERDSLSPKPKS